MKKLIISLLLFLSITTLFSQQDVGNDTDPINKSISNTAITIANQYPDYPATPGDIYDIFFLTGANNNQTLRGFVDTDYNIDLSFIGEVNVKGLIYSDVQKILKNKILSAYPGSIVNVIIASPGKFRITLLGEVNKAEIIESMSLTTLEQIIAGKTTPYASFRDIEIRSEDGSIGVYDLFQFTRYANKKNNPYLKPNDVITIRPYKRTVNISGEVRRPGAYQLLKTDTLEQVINVYADGFTKLADNNRIIIQKVLGNNERFNDRNIIIDTDNRELKLVKIDDFDNIIVSKKIAYNSHVELSGNVMRPGSYELVSGDTLYDLIHIYGDGFNKVADTTRIVLGRLLTDSEEVEREKIIINTDIDDLKSFVLRDFDTVDIPEILIETRTVTISGNIKTPGTFELEEGDTLDNLINIYGHGFNKVADSTRIVLGRLLTDSEEVEREKIIVNTDIDDLKSFVLRDFDTVDIPRILTETNTVTLSGNVISPGTFELEEGDTLDDLINIYGHGFNKVADTTRIVLGRLLTDSEEVEREKIIINIDLDDLKSIVLRDFDTVDIPKIVIETRNVTLSGNVKNPGTFELEEGDTLDHLINIYGHGFNKVADTTRIVLGRLLSGSEEVKREKVIINTEFDDLKSFVLRDFDTVDIPKILIETRKVTLGGQVKTPGAYELVEGDTLYDLINIYGHGFNKIAEISRIEIQRILDSSDENYREETFYIDGTKEDLKSIVLSDFDNVRILNKRAYSSKVIIQGAISPINDTDSISESSIQVGITVSNKLPVQIIDGNRVSTVLTKMNGIFNLSSSLEEAFILRGDKKIDVNLVEVMSTIDSEDDIVMMDKDILIVPFKQLLVYIAGSVNESKAVPFIENRTALYYIGLAGGMDRTENLFGGYSVRNVYGEKLSKDTIISPEDIIWVNRDHPMSYIEEYAGWATTIVSTAIISYQLMNIDTYLSGS